MASGDKYVNFAIESAEGEVVGVAPMRMPYADNAVSGTLDEPTVISFIPTSDLSSDGWYDLSGRKLNTKPYQKGVYIHNGKRVTIR